MLNFFSTTFKNKKKYFILLFLIIFLTEFFGIGLKEAGAQLAEMQACENNCRQTYANTDPTDPTMNDCILDCQRKFGSQTAGFGKILGEDLSREYGELADQLAIPFAAFVFGVGAVIISIGGSLSVLASNMLILVISMVDKMGCYTCMQNTAVANGWPRVRDLANMVVVLGFVVIGISTTLRFREYEAKKLLPKLIIAALLINFSLPICGIFIDGSNIVAKYFLQSGGFFANSWGQTLESQIKILTNEWSSNSSYIKAALGLIGGIAGITFYNIFAIIIFLLYAFLYIFRTIALWILVILSPLAFVFSVFPFTKKFFDMWWNNFLAWCIIIIPISFFVWLADKIMEGITKANAGNPTSFFAYLIPGSLMLLGFILSTQMSAMGAGAAVGAAKWTGGKAMGAVSGAAGATGLKGLAQRAGTGIKDAATGASEKYLGKYSPIKQGTTAGNKKARLEESTKRLEKGFDNTPEGNAELAKIATQRAITAPQQQAKAAAADLLAKRNAWDYIPKNQQEAVAAHAKAFGISTETLTEKRPQLLTGTTDKEATEKLRAERAATLETSRGWSADRASADAKNWTPSQTAIKDKKDAIDQEVIKQRALGYMPVQEHEMKQKLIDNEAKRLQTAAGGGHTQREAEIMANSSGFKPTNNDILNASQNLTSEKIEKAVQKLPTSKASELPEEAMVKEVAGHFNVNQMTNIYKNSTPALISKFRRALAERQSELRAAGNNTEADDLVDKIIEASRRARRP
ncbi:MAG: hypothetical protein A2998_02610 [Candidatus Staskawiczbacteria bacterium RIFCSPLOWO2_01_FULL_37_25b]|uniref:Uncharacterized protein n=2 Tax=Candidatus Staskawicziibacteriota TaxID=1817916 RepID=A0A1G2HRY1_9BACT|nr:MAG: hypothetical protein A2812_01995 [Candidatus Staskawiczbacteria bacterium RIFCSPHIGHO2_01_FULL_36_16]OGZ73758.1 MAG: hypothetical protein A2998_02610 [Candidatus Staskawiczbacteria bacterium RIFCSPLOWO2_01_FULL_37_25b]